jgi:hypothetical protein
MPEADSLWRTIKQKRLEIIQKQRTTASTKDGLIGIDDTERPKPLAKKPKVPNGNTANLIKREESATSQSPLSHNQSASLSIPYPTFQLVNLKTVKTVLSLKIKYK